MQRRRKTFKCSFSPVLRIVLFQAHLIWSLDVSVRSARLQVGFFLSSAAPRGRCASEKAVSSLLKNDALVDYAIKTRSLFETAMLEPVRTIISECHAISSYASVKLEFAEHHKDFVHSIGEIHSHVWQLLEDAKRIDRRLRSQTQKVTRKVASQVARSCLTKPKSKKRQDAAKRKANSLTSWHADFTAARKALQDTGYTGSFGLKKGVPMYTKIQEMQQARFHEIYSHRKLCVKNPKASELDADAP